LILNLQSLERALSDKQIAGNITKIAIHNWKWQLETGQNPFESFLMTKVNGLINCTSLQLSIKRRSILKRMNTHFKETMIKTSWSLQKT
jgi:hypothetical protein